MKPIRGEVAKFFSAFAFEDRTEEEWSEHDRKVEEARAYAAYNPPRSSPYDVEADRRARGLSVRAVEAALAADLAAPAMVAMAQWHREHPSDGIAVLSGSPGCGKTVAATWWALEAGALVVRSPTFATASRYDADTRERWNSARSLVLDDLGAEYADAKGSFVVDLDDLVDAHYSNKTRLVITTNCTAEEFKARYGQRIVDRLRECGSWLSIAGGSLRGRR